MAKKEEKEKSEVVAENPVTTGTKIEAIVLTPIFDGVRRYESGEIIKVTEKELKELAGLVAKKVD